MAQQQQIHPFLQNTIVEIKESGKRTYSPECPRCDDIVQSHTLLYCTKGKGEVVIDGSSSKFARKSLLLLPPQISFEITHSSSHGIEMHALSFDLYRLSVSEDHRRVYERELSFPLHGVIEKTGPRVQYLLRQFSGQSAPSKRSQSLYQLDQLYELLELILLENPDEDLPAAPLSDAPEQWLPLTVQYMQEHFDRDITVEKLGELAGMHPAYYSHLFKQKMNKTPYEFLTNLRMNKAKEMLLVSDKKIKEVAREVGYIDEFYFSRRFKTSSGYAPTTYSKQPHAKMISLSFPYTEHLLTLGVVPCAAQTHKYFPAAVKGLMLPFHASDPWEISRQAFLKLAPDLILCKDNVSVKARENLGDIAPIVTIPWTTLDVFGHLQMIAGIVNKQEAAQEWIDQYEKKAAKAHQLVADHIGDKRTVAICVLRETGWRMYGARNIGHVFYRSLQMLPPARMQAEMQKHINGKMLTWVAITIDELDQYESDYLFMVVPSREEAKKQWEHLQSNAAWQRHPAVIANRYCFLEWDQWKVYAPYSLERQLDMAVDLLTSPTNHVSL